jgi:predicted XRE-type DNA-binding protein
MSDKPKFTESSGNVFEDLGFEKEEAAALIMRADLMIALAAELRAMGKTQRELGDILAIGQSRVSDLLQSKAKLFSLDMLINLAHRIGMHVKLERERQPRRLPDESSTTENAAVAKRLAATTGAAFGTAPVAPVLIQADAAAESRGNIRQLTARDSSAKSGVYHADELRAVAA